MTLRIELDQHKVVVLLVVVRIVLLPFVITERLIERPDELGLLPTPDLVKNGGEVHRQPVPEHALDENPNNLDVHPRHERLAVVRLAPPRQSRAHVVHLHLQLLEGQGRLALLGRVVDERLADGVPLLAEDAGEVAHEVGLRARDELVTLVVPGLVHSLEYRHREQHTFGVLCDLLQTPRHDGTALLSVPVDSLAEVFGAPQSGGVAAPVRPAVPHQLGPQGVNIGREVLDCRPGHGHEQRAQVLRVLDAYVSHDLLVEDVV
mmetsp:Transcript_24372/g.57943  ORF Transcript_24372/g.57943 Transcript_24372/m.57943 type:complete len:262 (+) Transcript_24372:200-985(+)